MRTVSFRGPFTFSLSEPFGLCMTVHFWTVHFEPRPSTLDLTPNNDLFNMSHMWLIPIDVMITIVSKTVELMTYHSTVGVFILFVCRNHFYHCDWVLNQNRFERNKASILTESNKILKKYRSSISLVQFIMDCLICGRADRRRGLRREKTLKMQLQKASDVSILSFHVNFMIHENWVINYES